MLLTEEMIAQAPANLKRTSEQLDGLTKRDPANDGDVTEVLTIWDEFGDRHAVYDALVDAAQHSSTTLAAVCYQSPPRVVLLYKPDTNDYVGEKARIAPRATFQTPLNIVEAVLLRDRASELAMECNAFLCGAARLREIVAPAEKLNAAAVRQLKFVIHQKKTPTQPPAWRRLRTL